MKSVKSCGVLCVRSGDVPAFLLLRHRKRYDLPKGHVKAYESELETALRELREETGIGEQDISLDASFRYEHLYYPRYKRFGGWVVEKTLVIFLAYVAPDVGVRTSEHPSYKWFPVSESQRAPRSLRELLNSARRHLASQSPISLQSPITNHQPGLSHRFAHLYRQLFASLTQPGIHCFDKNVRAFFLWHMPT